VKIISVNKRAYLKWLSPLSSKEIENNLMNFFELALGGKFSGELLVW